MIDETSYRILKILQEKARIPNVEVARQVELAPSAVLERIRKMEKQGIIDGYEVRLNPKRFRYSEIAFVHVHIDATKLSEIEKALVAIPSILEIHLVTGSDALLLKVRCEDSAALGELLFKTIQPLDGVLSTNTESVMKTIKETSQIPLTNEFD